MERLTYYNTDKKMALTNHGEDAFKILSKLCDYEDAEEQGRLIRLPLAIGENFYEIFLRKDGWTDIVEWKVDFYCMCNNALYILDEDIYFDCEQFGGTLFYTREEAEAKLKEMEDKDND